jgi:hypothetical protein
MIAGFETGDTLTNGLNHSGPFVTRHYRESVFGCPGHQVPIAVADAGGGNFNQYFSGFGCFQIKGFNFKGNIGFVKNSRLNLHRSSKKMSDNLRFKRVGRDGVLH